MYEIPGYDEWKLKEPSESKAICYDWQGEAIYEGDEYYQTDFGKVLAIDDSLEEFTKQILGPLRVAECDGGYDE